MVRLVFRPYTQVRRPICTSGPLRTSTRVSSGFILLGHSSPSFGSQQACSSSNPQAIAGLTMDRPAVQLSLKSFLPSYGSLSFRVRVSLTQTLARMLDSLVRVSRRVVERHFVNVLGLLEQCERGRGERNTRDASSARLSTCRPPSISPRTQPASRKRDADRTSVYLGP